MFSTREITQDTPEVHVSESIANFPGLCLWYGKCFNTQTDPKTQASNNFLLLSVFVAEGTCSRGRCLATKGGIHFTGHSPNNDRRNKHTDTQTDGMDLLSKPLRWAQVP
jgi:hypothetical protein